MMEAALPKGIISQAVWLFRKRPSHLIRAARGYWLFVYSYGIRSLLGLGSNIDLGSNVRLQRNSALMAEKPGAVISIGDDSIIYENARIEAYGNARINIGNTCVIGDLCIAARYGVTIGDRFLSSWDIFIQDFDPHPIDPVKRAAQVRSMVHRFRPSFRNSQKSSCSESGWDFPGRAISIGNDVWVGANVTILKGAQIGDGCVIAANAVVTGGEYPSGSIIAGNPARVVKKL